VAAEIVIVGGGICGLATALACARQRIPVLVLEQASVLTETGAGVQVGPNAWRALHDLGIAGALEARAVLPHRWALMDIYTGRQITALEFGPDFVARYGAPYALLHRGELLTALINECSASGLVDIAPGAEVTGVTQRTDTATAHCADGSDQTASAVIGADGLHSVVRQSILDNRPPLISRYVVYRGLGPRPAGVDDSSRLYVGADMHLMQYPVSGGRMLNRVASFKSLRGEPGSEGWGTPAEFADRFSSACEYVRDAIQEMDLSRRWLLRDRMPAAGWAQGRVTLIGDAAHPMQQYLAQGACQALEDAVALGEAVHGSRADFPRAFQRFEAARFPRTSAVQRLSRFVGDICHAGGVTAVLRDHVLAQRAADDYGWFDWLYGGPADGRHPIPQLPASLDLYATSG
jgi:salicylate hydroxylase